MGKVTESILLTGEPVLLEKARKLAAVIISIKDCQERFVEPDAAATLLKTIGSIDQISIDSTDTIPVNLILGKLRRD